MYDASAMFQADVVDKGHFQFLIQQTGPDTADIDVRQWAIGSDYGQTPQSEHSFKLTNCRSLGNKMTCSAQIFLFVSDSVEIDVSPQPNTPSVEVKWGPIGATDVLAPVSQQDHDAVVSFLANASFPAP